MTNELVIKESTDLKKAKDCLTDLLEKSKKLVIVTKDDEKVVSDEIGYIKKSIKITKEKLKEIVDPYEKIIKNFKSGITQTLDLAEQAKDELETKLKHFLAEEERKEYEKIKAIQEEQKRKIEEKKDEAVADIGTTIMQFDGTIDTTGLKEQQEQIAQQAESQVDLIDNTKIEIKQRSYGANFKTSVIKKYKCEIVDNIKALKYIYEKGWFDCLYVTARFLDKQMTTLIETRPDIANIITEKGSVLTSGIKVVKDVSLKSYS